MKYLSLLLTTTALLFSSPARSETGPYRVKVGEASAADGLGARSFTLHQRRPGPGRESRLDQLMERFAAPRGAIDTRSYEGVDAGDDHILVKGDGWLLDVRGDGDWVRYWNLDYAEGPQNRPVPVAQRPTLAALDRIARKFVLTELASVVPLRAGEGLEVWYTAHLVSTVETLGGEREQLVYASKVVYTRTIDGLPVLGPGSKVVVHVAADGTPTGFDVDWSSFEDSGESQEALPLPEIRARGERLALAQGRAKDRVEDRFECGYYDAGARLAGAAGPLQVACLSSYRAGGAGAFTDAIPAATTVRRDLAWPEALTLAP